MRKIGITGSIGSGKSVVGGILRKHGYSVLDADKKVHELYASDMNLRKELSFAFGKECLTQTGVDKAFLAKLIFTNVEAKRRLESIVYPYLSRSIIQYFRNAFDEPYGKELVFVEAALFARIPEVVKVLDEAWIVFAPENMRYNRLMARGLSQEDARRRIETQRNEALPLVNKLVPIENEGDMESLEKRVLRLL
ncbi:MAG: dephospho-CoA kinase [Fibrobacteraceae bacterium]|nr:dephospho-CoA kinase [Fibrobacteraceae bacterium]